LILAEEQKEKRINEIFTTNFYRRPAGGPFETRRIEH
jgi:hypothetical protein